MLLKEYIEILQEIATEHGDDLVMVYGKDDEGNYFQAIHWPPSPGYWDGETIIDDPGKAMSHAKFNAVLVN